ncbi:unnamed protein product [Leptosia nina]|uniref:Uncharacterized protein n=1 Tax=Leptosia nina TaxID=320188 RepID=A0AAV1JSC0_9NEOP
MAKVKHPKFNNPIEKQFNAITRYHYCLFLLIFASKVPIFWHVLNLIFLSPPIEYSCNGNSSNLCPCDAPMWDRSVFRETMQTKFGIHCENSWWISFSHSVNFVGLLLGALLFGFMSDKFGRLLTFNVCCLILAISGCLISIMPTIASFTFMRCLEGIGCGGAIITAFVLCIEYCNLRHREVITALFHIPSNISHITLPGISYLFRHCDDFQLALSIPVFFFLSSWWLVMESPKWLMDNGKVDGAVAVMERFGRINGRPCENIQNEIEEYLSHRSERAKKKIKFWHIFRHKQLSLNLGCMSVIYFLCGMGYYGVSQYIGKMSELFPTSVRNSVLGFLSVLSRVGQISAPLINSLSETTSGLIFGVLALLGTVLCYFLPETKNSELPSSLDDTNTLTRRRTILKEDNSVTLVRNISVPLTLID